MQTDYTRIFMGSRVQAQGLISRLEAVGIRAILKDEAESARLAGFGSATAHSSEIYVHQDELAQAEAIVNQISDSL